MNYSEHQQELQCCILLANDNDTRPERVRRLLTELEFELKRFRSVKIAVEAVAVSLEQQAKRLTSH